MLPREYIKWLTAQPEAVLSIWPIRTKRRALGAMMSTVDHKTTIAFLDKIVGRFLTSNLGNVQVDVSDEMGASVDAALGFDEERWHEVNLMQTFKRIGDRTGVRALFGLELCRDQHFLRVLAHYNTLMGIGILLSGHMPPIIRPVGALLLVLPFQFCKARFKNLLTPVIKERMQQVACEPDDATLEDKPQDFLTQSVRVIMKDKRNACQSAGYVADQFLVLVSHESSKCGNAENSILSDMMRSPSRRSHQPP